MRKKLKQKRTVETPNMIAMYQTYMRVKKKKDVRLGEFLDWLFREVKHN